MDNGQPKNGNQMTGIFSAPTESASAASAAPENPAIPGNPVAPGSPYFTAGVGNIPPEINSDLANSIDKEEWQRSLEISAPVGMPSPEQLTNAGPANTEDTGLYTAENLTPGNPAPDMQGNQASKTPGNPQDLGQIIPLKPADQGIPTPEDHQQSNITPIEINGDHMSKSGIEKVDNAIEKLNQDHQLNSFYDEIRGSLSKEAQDAVGHINIDEQGEAA